MLSGQLRLWVLMVSAFAAVAGSSGAQTIIIDPTPIRPHPPRPRPPILPPIPPPRPRIPPRRNVPLIVKNHAIDVSITDGVAVTRVDQLFFNPQHRTVEGTYIFPLADDVALSKFSMFVGGKEIEGKLLSVAEARRTYESIVARMRDPALLEYVGTRMFKARIFPIAPKSEVRVRLSYTQMLETADGLVCYRYPLNTEKHLASPVELVTVVVHIDSKTPVKSVFSPSHKVAVTRAGEHKAGASFEGRDIYPDRDFDLFYTLDDKEFGLNVLAYRQADQDGFFLARIAPPVHTDAKDVLPKDIAFVIDTSSSMAGEKMNQAREALKFCLANLNAHDRFNIVHFSHEATKFRDSLIPATQENIAEGRTFADALRGTGGTNINDALLAALGSAPEADDTRPFLIVFLTDGMPTIGITDTDEILRNIRSVNATRVRLFVFGVGYDVNTHLLDLLAEQNRGARDYVSPKEDLELKLSSFYRKVADPVLADLSLSFGGLSVYDLYPPKLGDLFSGTELVVVGRYKSEGVRAVELTGTRRGRRERFVYETTFPGRDLAHEFLPSLWATRKIGYLLDEIRLHGENKELVDTIVTLATKYGVVTPYTAYLVTEPGGITRGRRAGPWNIMAEALGGLDAKGDVSLIQDAASHAKVVLQSRRAAQRVAPANGGAGRRAAVDASRQLHRMRQQQVAAPGGGLDSLLLDGAVDARTMDEQPKDAQIVRRVAGRTFYRIGQRWIDAAYDKEMKAAEVELFSEAYFELVRKNPELGKCFALGERVVVVLDGKAYETVPAPEPSEEDD